MVTSLFRSRIAGLFGRRPSIVVRPLDPASAESCYNLHKVCFAHPWSPTEFESLTASSSVLADGAYVDDTDELAGFVLSRMVAGEAEILTIAVDPNLRRTGVGAQLLDAHLTGLRLKRITSLFLEVEETNRAALALYGRAGFEQIGRRPNYYTQGRHTPAAALTMRKAPP